MADLSLLQEILAKPLSEIADVPEFETPPVGTYRLKMDKIESKKINDKPAVTLQWIVLQTKTLTDVSDKPVVDGSIFSEAFFFGDEEKSETSLSYMKLKFKDVAAELGATDLFALLNSIEGMEFDATVKNRANKDDPTKVYASTRDLSLAK